MKKDGNLGFAAIYAGVLVAFVSVTSSRAASVSFEAESGVLGSDFNTASNGTTQYITITTDTVNAEYPGNNNRVATYTVTFPAAGTYNFYARVRAGPGGATDDSFFYANGFGTKSFTTATDWIRLNSLLTGGFTNPSDSVTGSGTAGISVWKWLNLSQFANGSSEAGITFTVPTGNLTQTFQIGARENGFDMDKFVFATTDTTLTVAQLDADGSSPPPPPTPRDLVNGNLIQFNDNGAWSWYMDERVVIDKTAGKLVVGYDLSGSGVGGSPRNGSIEAVIYDLQTGGRQNSVLLPSGGHGFGCDDHDAPAFMVRPDGKYLATYAGHNNDNFSYFRIYSGGAWGDETNFNWNTIPGGTSDPTSYSNPHYLSAEGRVYDFVRCNNNKSPNILVSTNHGDTWSFYGQLVKPDGNVGYNSGYFRYSDNGVDRIDFICTEAHPRDILTSFYHGYISNGMSFKSDGTVVDNNLNDTNCPISRNFTPVFTNGTVMPPGQTNYRCWNDDVQLYADGTVQCIISSRINQSASAGYPDTGVDPNHAFFFCRYNGTNWSSTYLCQAGKKMYSDEGDYVGLGALHPNDPNTIYISTAFDPRAVQPGVTDTNLAISSIHEIWKGVTTNHGASFTWTPITQKSVRDNFRPLVPAWDANHSALLWFRGTYNTAQNYDAAVVGLIESHSETVVAKTYVDATTNNTTLATGAPLVTSAAANQWHERSTAGNGGSVFASADTSAENAPALKTTVTLPAARTCDVWINFWGNPGADWRIVAGLSTKDMQLFRQMACKEVETGDHDTTIILTNAAGYFLYQAYLGRVTNSTLEVFVDDNAIQTGTTGTLVGDTARTWYDGVSYAKINPFQIASVTHNPAASSATLTWNSIPQQLSLTTPTYTVQKKNSLTDADWITLANGLPSQGSTTTYTDTSATNSAAFYRITSP
jgi:BNR repeat-containing family member